jgi:hypothetical protein
MLSESYAHTVTANLLSLYSCEVVAQTNKDSLFLLITVGFHNHYSDLRVGR